MNIINSHKGVAISTKPDDDGNLDLFFNEIRVGYFGDDGNLHLYSLSDDDVETLESLEVNIEDSRIQVEFN